MVDPGDFEACYAAVQSRDRRFDGRFVTGVLSTGIFCRPSCPARTPGRNQVRFFPTTAAAQASGLRACRRCRPELAPDVADHSAALAARALRLIEAGAGDDGAGTLAGRLHVSERHLRRVLVQTYGAGPGALVRMRRVRLARMLIDQTDLPLARVAFEAGFGSVRQFNDVMRQAFHLPPGALRRGRGGPGAGAPGADGGTVVLRLAVPEPFDPAWPGRWMALHGTPDRDHVEGPTYTRTTEDGTRLRFVPSPDGVHVEVPVAAGTSGAVRGAVAVARQVFDTDADIAAVTAALGADALLGPLIDAAPGLRIPGAPDPWEGVVRIVLGQQVSAAAAGTLMERLAALTARPEIPDPDEVADADIGRLLGVPRQRATALRAVAAAVAAGLDLSPGADPEVVVGALRDLPGIGPWTASTTCLVVLRHPDAWPSGDVALRRAVGTLVGNPVTTAELDDIAQRWRPWRGYAAMWLWHRHLHPVASRVPTTREPAAHDPAAHDGAAQIPTTTHAPVGATR